MGRISVSLGGEILRRIEEQVLEGTVSKADMDRVANLANQKISALKAEIERLNVSRQNGWVSLPEDAYDIMLADARLGAAVRRMPLDTMLRHGGRAILGQDDHRWFAVGMTHGIMSPGIGDTPEEAILDAFAKEG